MTQSHSGLLRAKSLLDNYRSLKIAAVLLIMFFSTQSFAQMNSNGMRVFNVMLFGAKGDSTTDDTQAIIAAIQAASDNGGGVVFFPKPAFYYNIAGALGACNCQIPIPPKGGLDRTRTSIILRGESRPVPDPAGFGAVGDAGNSPSVGQVRLVSTLQVGATGAAVIGTAQINSTFNKTSLSVENLAIQVDHNPAGAGPVLGGINYKNGGTLNVDYVTVFTDTSGYRSVLPVNDVAGIETPDHDADQASPISHTTVVGFRKGFSIGEHVVLNDVLASTNYYNYYLKPTSALVTAIKASSFTSPYPMYFAGNIDGVSTATHLGHFELYLESYGPNAFWFNEIATVMDSANFGKGEIYYHYGGNHNSYFAKSGGANLYCYTTDDGMLGGTNTWKAAQTISSATVPKITLNSTDGNIAAATNYSLSSVNKYGWQLNPTASSLNDFGLYDFTTTKLLARFLSGEIRLGGNATSTAASAMVIKADSNAYFNRNLGVKNTLSTNNFAVNVPTTADALAESMLSTSVATQKGLVIQGKVNQSASYQEWQASTGGILGSFLQPQANTTLLRVHPLNANTESAFFAYDSPLGSNYNYAALFCSSAGSWAGVTGYTGIASTKVGSATQLPMTFGGFNGSWSHWMTISTAGKVGIGQAAASNTAWLHLKAGTTAATTAPLKFTAGSLMTTPEAFAKEANASSTYQTTNALNRFAEGGAIKDFYADVNNSGTSETDLLTYTTKANTFAAIGEKLIFEASGTLNDLTATAQLQFYFGGTNIGNTGALTVSATGGWYAKIIIIVTAATTARAVVTLSTPGASTAQYTTETDITGLTITNTNIIKITGTAGGASGGSGDITSKLGTIFWWGAANN